MPRSGVNGTYSLPANVPDKQPQEIIRSSWANSFSSDLEQSLNTPQPITYGGSGAATAVGALDAFNTKGADIPSAATTNIWAATGVFVHITGTTTITSFGTASAAGNERAVVFDGSLSLTHSANLLLPGGTNIVTRAGDVAFVRSEGGAVNRVVGYTRNARLPVEEVIDFYEVTPALGAQPNKTWSGLGDWLHVWLDGEYFPTAANSSLFFQEGFGGVDTSSTYVAQFVTGQGSVSNAFNSGATSSGQISGAGGTVDNSYVPTVSVKFLGFGAARPTRWQGASFSRIQTGEERISPLGGRHSVNIACDTLRITPLSGNIGVGSNFILKGIRKP